MFLINKFLFIALLFATQLFYSSVAHADVYKWVDDDGRVVYGDRPVSDNAKKLTIKKMPPQDSKSIETLSKQKKLLDVMQQERDEKIARAQEEKAKKAKQQQKCAEVKKELKRIRDAGYLYEKTDDPSNPRIFSDEERKAIEEKHEKYIQAHC